MADARSPRGHLKAVSNEVRQWPAVMRVRSSAYTKAASKAPASNGTKAAAISTKAEPA